MHKDKNIPIAIYSTLEEARRWRLASLALGLVVVVLSVAIAAMMPLKDTKIRYVEFSNSKDNFFTVYPSNMPKQTYEILGRKQLRNYVYNRHSRNNIEDNVRLTKVKAMSPALWPQIVLEQQEWKENNSGVKRNVEILSDTVLTGNTHQVVFKTIDTDEEGQTTSNVWTATIQYRIHPVENVTQETLYHNPMAIEITRYTIDKVKE